MTVREKLFDDVLSSIYRNTSTLGTGVILILVGQSMRAGSFTLGDFSLFVYLLQSMGDLTTFAGMLANSVPSASGRLPAGPRRQRLVHPPGSRITPTHASRIGCGAP